MAQLTDFIISHELGHHGALGNGAGVEEERRQRAWRREDEGLPTYAPAAEFSCGFKMIVTSLLCFIAVEKERKWSKVKEEWLEDEDDEAEGKRQKRETEEGEKSMKRNSKNR